MTGYREMAAFVDNLLGELALTPPITLKELVTALTAKKGFDLRAFRAPLPGEIGGLGLADEEGRTIILINRRRELFAEDYTLLHELGHLVLGHLQPGHRPAPEDEYQADLFARIMFQRLLRPVRRSLLARLKKFFHP